MTEFADLMHQMHHHATQANHYALLVYKNYYTEIQDLIYRRAFEITPHPNLSVELPSYYDDDEPRLSFNQNAEISTIIRFGDRYGYTLSATYQDLTIGWSEARSRILNGLGPPPHSVLGRMLRDTRARWTAAL